MIIDWRPHRYRGGSGWLTAGLFVANVGVVAAAAAVVPISIIEFVGATYDPVVRVTGEYRPVIAVTGSTD